MGEHEVLMVFREQLEERVWDVEEAETLVRTLGFTLNKWELMRNHSEGSERKRTVLSL